MHLKPVVRYYLRVLTLVITYYYGICVLILNSSRSCDSNSAACTELNYDLLY